MLWASKVCYMSWFFLIVSRMINEYRFMIKLREFLNLIIIQWLVGRKIPGRLLSSQYFTLEKINSVGNCVMLSANSKLKTNSVENLAIYFSSFENVCITIQVRVSVRLLWGVNIMVVGCRSFRKRTDDLTSVKKKENQTTSFHCKNFEHVLPYKYK